MSYISIPDAATVSGKSIQTIRRMVKTKKIRIRKQKTPQGFVYMIERASLEEFLGSPLSISTTQTTTQPTTQTERLTTRVTTQPTTHRLPKGLKLTTQPTTQTTTQPGQTDNQWQKEVEKFSTTIQKLIEQNEKDKDNFFNLVKSFQDRVFVLENQIKLLEAPKKKWWKIWV